MSAKTKKLTDRQSEFVKLVQQTVGKLASHYNINHVLISNGFKEVNAGGFKTVYKKRGYDYCVKVWHQSWGWKQDSYKVPKLLRHHYVHPIYQNKRYLIQPWIKGKYSDYGYKRPVKKLPFVVINSVYDVREDNIRVRDNREVVIDFCYVPAACSP